MQTTKHQFNFIEVPTTRNRINTNTANIVRASFALKTVKRADGTFAKKNSQLMLYIGKEIAAQLDLSAGDKVRLFVESNDPKTWFIKKSTNGQGNTLVDARQPNGTFSKSLRLQFTWTAFNPVDDDCRIRELKTKIYNDGLVLFFGDVLHY